MKSVGIVGYANSSGLGQMISALRKQKLVHSQFVISHPIKGTNDLEDFPHTSGDLSPTPTQFIFYLDTCKPNVLIFIETPFNFDFFEIAHNRGIRVILIPMVDSISYVKFQPYLNYIDLFLMVTKWGYSLYSSHYPDKTKYLPWPIDTDYFHPDKIQGTMEHHSFLHNQGFGGAGYRKATDQVITAFRQLSTMNKTATLLLNSQPNEDQHSQVIQNVPQISVYIRDYPEAIDVYKYGAIYVAPSRREGLGLPIREAMACGLPVITTNAPPMNELFSDDYPLFVKVHTKVNLQFGDIPLYEANAYDLMLKMQWAINHPQLCKEIGEKNRKEIENNYSWNTPVTSNNALLLSAYNDKQYEWMGNISSSAYWHQYKRVFMGTD